MESVAQPQAVGGDLGYINGVFFIAAKQPTPLHGVKGYKRDTSHSIDGCSCSNSAYP